MIREFDFETEPVVEIVNQILYDAKKRRASDVHFDPRPKGIVVRVRVDGALRDYALVPLKFKQTVITRIKIIAGMNITENRLPQDGSIKTQINDEILDLRVSSLPTNNGEKIVIRILDYSASMQGIETLGFTEDNLVKLEVMMKKPDGIILVTGATGVGKSTTVYAILQKLNTPDRNIVTVEDPIEMDIQGINQVKVNANIDLSFANVLRSIFRQDPNVIMVGEIRDTITAQIAIRASITGHLVLTTIHTNDSLSTIERLLDMDVERYLLATALSGIISQRLSRKLCPVCSTTRPTTKYEKHLFKQVLGKDVNEVKEPHKCDKCYDGYYGRIAIHEVLLINQDIRDKIADNVAKDELRELVYKDGHAKSLLQDGLLKVEQGLTTLEEILKVIEIDDELSSLEIDLDNNEVEEKKEEAPINAPLPENNVVPPTPTVIPQSQATPAAQPAVEVSREDGTDTLLAQANDNIVAEPINFEF